jgi:hypothetical protein
VGRDTKERRLDPIEIAIGLSIFVGSTGTVALVLMVARAALGRWSSPRVESPDEGVRKLEEAIGRLSEEITDLHERTDFAERVLATQREPERLEEGKG